jgi:hypothetical protein
VHAAPDRIEPVRSLCTFHYFNEETHRVAKRILVLAGKYVVDPTGSAFNLRPANADRAHSTA